MIDGESLKGVQRIIRSLEDFIDSNFFQAQLLKLRAEYSIPKNGFPLINKDKAEEWSLINFPKEWRFLNDKSVYGKLNLEIEKIIEKFSFPNYLWLGTMLRGHIFYNYLGVNLIRESLTTKNFCWTVDEREKFYEYADWGEDIYIKDIKKEIQMYPISIRISPYASRRTIEEYIKKTYSKSIKPLQEKYKDIEFKFGTTRMKNKTRTAINKKIYELRHLPLKKITELINKEFSGSGTIVGYEEISGIVARERKRRS